MAIAENPHYIANGKLDSKISTHKLAEISLSLKTITFSQEEKDFIELPEEALPYWGRYPSAKKAGDKKEEKFISADIKLTFDKLFSKIDIHLYNSIKDGWQGPHDVRLSGVIRSDYENLPQG